MTLEITPEEVELLKIALKRRLDLIAERWAEADDDYYLLNDPAYQKVEALLTKICNQQG